jgi:P27 family predicted phage terminase small subunit
MGARGPAPTPTAVLQLRGSWRANARKGEPKAPREIPTCPGWLDAAAKSAWNQLAPLLHQMGVLTLADANVLTRYCITWSRWKAAEQWIQDNGEVAEVETDSGTTYVPHPQVRIAAMLGDQLGKMEQQLGLTPAARARLTVDHGEGEEETGKGPNKARFFERPG